MAYESIDIKLDVNFQPVRDADGDFKITNQYEGLLQEIELEACSQEGELFWDGEYGWSLLDFIHASNDELTLAEIQQRCKTKMAKYDYVEQTSVKTTINFESDMIKILIDFEFLDSDEVYNITISLDRINIEVTIL